MHTVAIKWNFNFVHHIDGSKMNSIDFAEFKINSDGFINQQQKNYDNDEKIIKII